MSVPFMWERSKPNEEKEMRCCLRLDHRMTLLPFQGLFSPLPGPHLSLPVWRKSAAVSLVSPGDTLHEGAWEKAF